MTLLKYEGILMLAIIKLISNVVSTDQQFSFIHFGLDI
jgi:hypothetical protein